MSFELDDATVRAVRAFDDEWARLLEEIGFALARSDEAWVSYDGAGRISVAPEPALDRDDFLGQIVLHEICHHLVEGPGSAGEPDWGLDNMSDAHVVHEHAALRLQARLADEAGGRAIFVATTDFRAYYESLPAAPLDASEREQEERRAVALAQTGWKRFQGVPWRARLLSLLRQTVAATKTVT